MRNMLVEEMYYKNQSNIVFGVAAGTERRGQTEHGSDEFGSL